MQAKAPQPTVVDQARANGDHQYVRSTNAAMKGLERAAEQLALLESPVLIVGESGSGKRALAQRLHRLSVKNGEPYRELTATQINQEFMSRAEDANSLASILGSRGTLYITGLSELLPNCQLWLLHVVAREGNGSAPNFAGRLVISSVTGLDELVSSGRLREDLYYILSGICMRVPPLRHRRDDIPALSEHFVEKYCSLFGRPKPILSPGLWRYFLEHNWPNNVRELENTVKTLVAIGDERLAVPALAVNTVAEPIAVTDGMSLKQAARAASRRAERELILRVLNKTRWNRKRAAQELKVSYKALLYKLKQIGLDDETISEESTL